MFDFDHTAFDTLAPVSEGNSVTKPIPAGQHKNGAAPPATLAAVARSIHARHPSVRLDCNVDKVEKKLSAILKHKHVPNDQRDVYLRRIDANHACMCSTEQWTKDGGAYAKGLTNWLAPTEERYNVEVNGTAAVASTTRLMA
jgi:hypothetical protein